MSNAVITSKMLVGLDFSTIMAKMIDKIYNMPHSRIFKFSAKKKKKKIGYLNKFGISLD